MAQVTPEQPRDSIVGGGVLSISPWLAWHDLGFRV